MCNFQDTEIPVHKPSLFDSGEDGWGHVHPWMSSQTGSKNLTKCFCSWTELFVNGSVHELSL